MTETEFKKLYKEAQRKEAKSAKRYHGLYGRTRTTAPIHEELEKKR